jgi:hypothetical protein
MTTPRPRGFSRTDILAIFLITATVATAASVDFIDSLTRTRVARSQADLRELAVAIDAYVVDHRVPPNDIGNGWPWYLPDAITTPVAYLDEIPSDAFRLAAHWETPYFYSRRHRYVNYIAGRDVWPDWGLQFGGWIDGIRSTLTPLEWNETMQWLGDWKLSGVGPDAVSNLPFLDGYALYDPTNGTVSIGDIVHTQRLGPVLP